MKSTGIVRRIDELGRIVLPIELRRTLDIEIKDPMEIYIEGDKIVLKKHYDACVFCRYIVFWSNATAWNTSENSAEIQS